MKPILYFGGLFALIALWFLFIRTDSAPAPVPEATAPALLEPVTRVATPTPPPRPPAPASSEAAAQLEAERAQLAAENARLRAALEAVQAEIADERAARIEAEGAPLDFPAGYPEAFGEAALKAAFEALLAEQEVGWGLMAIDCTEWPCLVYGEAALPGEERAPLEAAERALHDSIAARWPGEAHNLNVSMQGMTEETTDGITQRTRFGVAVYPKREDNPEGARKRLKFRSAQFFDSFRRPE